MTRRFAHVTEIPNRMPTCRDPAAEPSPVSAKEHTARAALEARAGRVFSDPEWQQARSRLLEFASLLRAWEARSTTQLAKFPQAA